MRKTMARIVAVAVLLILLAAGACAALFFFGSGTPFEGTRVRVVNTLLDETGIKQRVEDELYSKAAEVAEQTGLPVELVNEGVKMVDVTHWRAAELPEGSVANGTLEAELDNQNMKLTTYEDPSFVTVEAYGQSITFDVPESTQNLTKLVPFVSAARDEGVLEALSLLASP